MGGGSGSHGVDPSRVVADAVERRHHELIELLVVERPRVVARRARHVGHELERRLPDRSTAHARCALPRPGRPTRQRARRGRPPTTWSLRAADPARAAAPRRAASITSPRRTPATVTGSASSTPAALEQRQVAVRRSPTDDHEPHVTLGGAQHRPPRIAVDVGEARPRRRARPAPADRPGTPHARASVSPGIGGRPSRRGRRRSSAPASACSFHVAATFNSPSTLRVPDGVQSDPRHTRRPAARAASDIGRAAVQPEVRERRPHDGTATGRAARPRSRLRSAPSSGCRSGRRRRNRGRGAA